MKFSDGRLAELDAQIKSSIIDMAVAGQVPAGRKYQPGIRVPDETITLEDGRQATIQFHKARNVYQLTVTNESGNTDVIKEAASLTDLTYSMLDDQGQATLQRQDIELENARIESGQPEGFRGYEEGSEETGAATEDWLQNYPHTGQIYADTIKYVSSAESRKMYAQVMGMLGKLRLPLTAPNLDLAMRELWDNNDEFASYIDEGRAEKQRLADKAAAVDQAKANQDAKIYPNDQPATPYAPPFVRMQVGGTKQFGLNEELTPRQLVNINRKKLDQ